MLTSKLLESIGFRTFAPEGQTTFTQAELLMQADEEMKTTILPALLGVREEYTVVHKDFAITANQAAYAIPARSVGLQVRDVHIVDGNTVIPDFPRTEPERINSDATGQPDSFYLKGNNVMLFPTPSATSRTLRLYYPLRPSELIVTTSAAVIDSIDTGTNTVTVVSPPDSWVTGTVFDLIKQDGGCECLAIDETSTLVSGTAITFSSLPSTLRVGDYVSPAGYTPLVQLPPDLQPVLAQATAALVLENMNQPGSTKAREKAGTMLKAAIDLLTPRTPGEARVISNNQWNI